ncbi:MAG: CobW family GTP-binding protein [Pseudomonadota bacterium]|nr:CobW family GTP-binding protein [Pseudomonadota bacterium]MEC8675360.1 CobW family GTP-binding protein [Pseudomonadota bacterium]
MTASTPSPIPATVIGGYLGAGKTTLVNHLLRTANGLRLAVLVNEFGALPIDDDLIIAREDNLISLAGGCVCCSFGSDLMAALMDLSQLSPPPERVLIEASGVAMPGAIAASVDLLPAYAVDGVLVLADSETVRARADDPFMGDTIRRQLGEADLILLSKCDVPAPADLAATEAWLASEALTAAVVPMTATTPPPRAVLFDLAAPAPWRHGGTDTLGHDQAYDSLILTPPPALDADAVADALAARPHGILRAKGVLPSARHGGLAALQMVGARLRVEPLAGGAPRHSGQVVVIGLRGQLDRPALEALFPAPLSSAS